MKKQTHICVYTWHVSADARTFQMNQSAKMFIRPLGLTAGWCEEES